MSVITLPEYKAYVGIKSPNDDAALFAIVDFVNAYIVNYCNISFSATVVTEKKITSENGFELLVPNVPLISVEELRFGTEVVDPSFYLVHNAIAVVESLSSFSTARYSFEIDYTHGYVEPPADLMLVAMEFVTHLKKREFNKSRSLGNGETADYGSPELIPAQVRVGLSMYRAP